MKHQRLCKEIERVLGHTVKTAADFEELAAFVFKVTRKQVSSTTLKRMWGYLDEDVETRRSTLDLLAHVVGCRSYDDFLQTAEGVQSNFVLTERLESNALPVGQRVRLSWWPDRVVVVQYLGSARFRVLESVNSKLAVDDTFSCHLMIAHEPLFLDNLVHQGGRPMPYVMGRQDGISFRLLADSDSK